MPPAGPDVGPPPTPGPGCNPLTLDAGLRVLGYSWNTEQHVVLSFGMREKSTTADRVSLYIIPVMGRGHAALFDSSLSPRAMHAVRPECSTPAVKLDAGMGDKTAAPNPRHDRLWPGIIWPAAAVRGLFKRIVDAKASHQEVMTPESGHVRHEVRQVSPVPVRSSGFLSSSTTNACRKGYHTSSCVYKGIRVVQCTMRIQGMSVQRCQVSSFSTAYRLSSAHFRCSNYHQRRRGELVDLGLALGSRGQYLTGRHVRSDCLAILVVRLAVVRVRHRASRVRHRVRSLRREGEPAENILERDDSTPLDLQQQHLGLSSR